MLPPTSLLREFSTAVGIPHQSEEDVEKCDTDANGDDECRCGIHLVERYGGWGCVLRSGVARALMQLIERRLGDRTIRTVIEKCDPPLVSLRDLNVSEGHYPVPPWHRISLPVRHAKFALSPVSLNLGYHLGAPYDFQVRRKKYL